MDLKSGITRRFCQLIDPGNVPAGFRAEMKLNSEKYHDIWLDNEELTDYYKDCK